MAFDWLLHKPLIDSLSKRECIFVIGSGISKCAGLPDWSALLEPLKRQYLTSAPDDPLDVAELIARMPNGRHLLLKHIRDTLNPAQGKAQPQPIHAYIRRIDPAIMITTNFDTLIEDAYRIDPEVHLSMVCQDDDLLWLEDGERTLLKLNGCVTQPRTIRITRTDFEQHDREQVEGKITTLFLEKTFFFCGFSFNDPAFQSLYGIVRKRFHDRGRPHFILLINPSRGDTVRLNSIGLHIIDLAPQDGRDVEEVTGFFAQLEAMVNPESFTPPGVRGTAQRLSKKEEPRKPDGGDHSSLDVTSISVPSILTSRLGSGLSVVAGNEYIDRVHRYDKILREDYLDYTTGDFISIRCLTGINASPRLSEGVLYVESSECKLSFEQCNIRAIDLHSKKDLVVESIREPLAKDFQIPFRIRFPMPLQPFKKFAVAYYIMLPGELRQLRRDDEMMSISLSRIGLPLSELSFSVSLSEPPVAVAADSLSGPSEGYRREGDVPARLLKKRVSHATELEEFFGVKRENYPWRISTQYLDPRKQLYSIHYKLN